MTAIPLIGGRFLGTSAERVAYTTTNLRSGWIWVESDTGKQYFWNGTVWSVILCGAPIVFGGGRQPSTAALIYMPLFGNTTNINTNSTTESLTTLPINFTFAPTKLSVKLTATNSLNGNIVVTFRDDAADVTNSTVTILTTDTAAGTLKESTGTMSIIASGSLCCWKVDATAASTGTAPILTMIIQGYIY